MTKPSLSLRRKQLIERCAEQRTGLAYELRALRPGNVLAAHPLVGYLSGCLAGRKKWVLGALGAGLALALVRRKRLPGQAGAAGPLIRTWKLARAGLMLLARFRA